VLRKLGIAIALALVFALIGLNPDVGFRVHSLAQLSFLTHNQLGYADADVNFSATYNPLLFPFYWVTGNGFVNGTFAIIYYPESVGAGDFAVPVWGYKPSDRYEQYTIEMTTWGFWPNVIILLLVTVFIEAARARVLYFALFSGILGFYFAELYGMVIGLVVGVILGLFIKFKLPKDNRITRFWYSLWE
jgi:hypothetical protein